MAIGLVIGLAGVGILVGPAKLWGSSRVDILGSNGSDVQRILLGGGFALFPRRQASVLSFPGGGDGNAGRRRDADCSGLAGGRRPTALARDIHAISRRALLSGCLRFARWVLRHTFGSCGWSRRRVSRPTDTSTPSWPCSWGGPSGESPFPRANWWPRPSSSAAVALILSHRPQPVPGLLTPRGSRRSTRSGPWGSANNEQESGCSTFRSLQDEAESNGGAESHAPEDWKITPELKKPFSSWKKTIIANRNCARSRKACT